MNNLAKSKIKFTSILVICFLLCAFLSACGKEKSFEEQLYEKLSNLPSVVEVNKLEQKNPDFDNQYEVFFEMPLDWNDPDGETFKQRVIIDGKSFDKSTVVELQGYNIGENIKVYTHPSNNHRVKITDFEENTQKEIMNYLTDWMN